MPVPASISMPTIDFSVVRDLRKAEGLTLQQVADRSGLSVAGLSKLERNQNLIELETLYRLARVFGLTATDLLSLAESRSAQRKSVQRYQSGPFDFEKLTCRGLDLFHATARAGDSLQHPEAHGDEYEVCWVREGEINILFSHERHALHPGEALQFDAILPHTYEIIRDASLVIAHLTKSHRF